MRLLGILRHAEDADGETIGVLGAKRKPFQDSPTPAGNSVAAIALSRLYAFTNDHDYRNQAEQTLEVLSDMAGQYGIFAATYGIAAVHFSQPYTQIIVLGGDDGASQLYAAAVKEFYFGKTALKLAVNQVIAENLPAALAETIPQLPAVKGKKTIAVVCSGFACQPPITNAEELAQHLRLALRKNT